MRARKCKFILVLVPVARVMVTGHADHRRASSGIVAAGRLLLRQCLTEIWTGAISEMGGKEVFQPVIQSAIVTPRAPGRYHGLYRNFAACGPHLHSISSFNSQLFSEAYGNLEHGFRNKLIQQGMFRVEVVTDACDRTAAMNSARNARS